MNKMKKAIGLILLCGVLLSGCGNNQLEPETTVATETTTEEIVAEIPAESKARTVEVNYEDKYKAYFKFNEKGLLVSEENKPDGAPDITYLYDEENRITEIIKKSSSEEDSSGERITYEYNADGNLAKRTTFDLDDNTYYEYCEYEYDNGNLVKVSFYENYDGKTSLSYYDEYVYEETDSGTVVTSRSVSADGSVGEASSTYDKNGRLISEEYPSGAGSTEYVYDENGNLIKEIYGNNERELVYEYEDGVLVKAYWTKDEFSSQSMLGYYREYKHFDNGNIKVTYWCTPTGETEEINIDAIPEVKGNFAKIELY